MTIMEIEYEPSPYFLTTNIAGFQFYGGAKFMKKLSIGDEIQIAREKNNPYDLKAIALLYQGEKIGFLNKGSNREIFQILEAGHDFFECRISQIDVDEHPNQQLSVVVNVLKKGE